MTIPSLRHAVPHAAAVRAGPCRRGLVATLVLACLAPLAARAIADAPPRRPNVVLILADDLGYGDLGCYGQTRIRTPHLDRLASEGLRFTQFYAGSAVCAPSRCTLLTGRHTGHATVRDNTPRGPGLEGQHRMEAGTVTLARLLDDAGYATGIVGKWGLGMPEDQSGPLQSGFDHHYGYLCQSVAHTFYPAFLWRNDRREPLPGNPDLGRERSQPIPLSGTTYAPDPMIADALDWIRNHAHEPFFLYFASTLPHLSLQVPEASLAEYRGLWPETPVTGSRHYANQPAPRAAYAAMVSRLDRDVGRIVALLDELSLAENTLVLFGSDNGAVRALSGTDPEFFRSNGPLRGHKQQLWEGGIRTPFIARWTGRIAPGGTTDLVAANWDVLPTICELVGIAAPTGIDGVSLAPTLLGKPGQPHHEHLYWEYHGDGGRQAVRFGDWKAVRERVREAPDAVPQLFDLARDPGETRDVAAEHPDVAARAEALMQSARTPSAEPRWNFR